jgi:hypothetical protein
MEGKGRPLIGSLILALLLCLAPLAAYGQTRVLSSGGGGGFVARSYTVATKPTSAPVGTVIAITDGNSSSDCIAGGGTTVVSCRWNGSAWSAFGDGSTAGSGGAPDTAPYLTKTPVAGLTAEEALSLLATGLMINTTSTGVPTIYGGASCTSQFIRSLTASGAATCAGVATTDLSFDVATQAELGAVQTALQDQIDDLGDAVLGYDVKTLQTLSADGSINCTPGPGFIGAIAPIVGDAPQVELGITQIVNGTSNAEFCLLLGTNDVNTVRLFNRDNVLLAQDDNSIELGSRGGLWLQWSGTVWRQVDQFGVVTGAVGGSQGLQDTCDVDCAMTDLPEAAPYILAPFGLTGPQEHVFSPDGNFYRVRYQAPGVLAGPEATVIEVDTCWDIKAVLGLPLSEQVVGSLCDVGGTSVTASGVFAPAASAIPLTPQAPMVSTNVQAGINELNTRNATWHLPWSASGALVDGTNCVTQAKAAINSGPNVISVICADAAGTIEFSFDTPARYTGGAITMCFEVNDAVDADNVWDAAVIAQFRGSGSVVNNTWSTAVEAAATLATANAGYFACATATPNGAAAGVGRVFVKATIDNAGGHTDTNARVLGGYVTGP